MWLFVRVKVLNQSAPTAPWNLAFTPQTHVTAPLLRSVTETASSKQNPKVVNFGQLDLLFWYSTWSQLGCLNARHKGQVFVYIVFWQWTSPCDSEVVFTSALTQAARLLSQPWLAAAQPGGCSVPDPD